MLESLNNLTRDQLFAVRQAADDMLAAIMADCTETSHELLGIDMFSNPTSADRDRYFQLLGYLQAKDRAAESVKQLVDEIVSVNSRRFDAEDAAMKANDDHATMPPLFSFDSWDDEK